MGFCESAELEGNVPDMRKVPSKEAPEAQQEGTELTAAQLAHTAEAVEGAHAQKEEL